MNSAPEGAFKLRRIREIEIGLLGARAQAGLTFIAKHRQFLVLHRQPSPLATGKLDLSSYSSRGDREDSKSVSLPIRDPVNTIFDNSSGRLLILDSDPWRFLAFRLNDENDLEWEALPTIDATLLGLNDPQGITADPGGRLYILDVFPNRIIQAEFLSNRSVSLRSVTFLKTGIGSDVRGIAFDPKSGHIFISEYRRHRLLELTTEGRLIAAHDLSEVLRGRPQGLMFAPTGDTTDDPSAQNLYVVEAKDSPTSFFADGSIAELSVSPMPKVSIAATTVIADLVQTVHTYLFSPPSPDPAGIAFYPPGNSLWITDCEVEEMSIYEGTNVFEMQLNGSQLRTEDVTWFTDEPTGISYNPDNGHFFISDDDARRIYDLDPGSDGIPFTADDTVVYFSVSAAGSEDPEDVAYDYWRGFLYWVDGINNEVYRSESGANGIFDGPPPNGDDVVTHFDTSSLGVEDPEGIAFNTDSGNLFLMGISSSVIAETDMNIELLRIIDASATQAHKPAGLGYAPSSVSPGAMDLFIVARGVDNNENSNENDGEVYEITFPPLMPGNLAPEVDAGPDQTIRLPDSAVLSGTATDDGYPDPPGTLTAIWQQVDGPGIATFADANAWNTTASFSSAGIYVLRLTASDGDLSSSDSLNVIVETAAGYTPIDIRISGGSDDAEEDAAGSVALWDGLLELVDNAGLQTVGLCFNNVGIPRDASIGSAYIQFTAAEISSEVTNLDIRGEAADNAATFSTAMFDISSRPGTVAVVSWSPAAWQTVGEVGLAQRTIDLSPVIQEIVTRPGWSSGASLAVIITGTGKRVAESFNSSAANAPLLHVEYTTAPVPAHDVAVTSVTAPTPVEVGQAEIVTVDVSNEGEFVETFQVSLSDSLGATVGSLQTVTDLEVGGSMTLSFDWTPTEAGDHILTATAETLSGETDTADNVGTASAEVTALPVHDVAVISATAPTPVIVGEAQIVTVDVSNEGTVIETFDVSLTDSLGATVGPLQTVTDLDAGGSIALSFDWTPNVTGTHILTATASTVSGETDTADNIGTATVEVNPVPIHDVAVTNVSAPTPVEVGLAQVVAVDVTNEGTAAETFQVSLSDSLGATVGPPQTVTDLGVGGNLTLSFDWTPSVIGTHVLTATAAILSGETDTADNVGTTTAEVNPLTVHDIAVTSVTAPTPVIVSQTQTVTVDVANEGTVAETFQVSLSDSLGATVGPPQTVTNLGVGGSVTLSFDWTPGVTGTHILTATAETVSGETDTADNLGTASSEVNPVPVHNIAVTSVTAPTPVTIGQTQIVTVNVSNLGTFVETFQVSLSDSLGATVGPPQTVTNLQTGGSIALSFDWIPSEMGTHVLTAVAETVAGETDTSDNVTTATSEVADSMTLLDISITARSDDAEEAADGVVDINSSDLELVEEDSIQTVGMRFNNVSIPNGSTIAGAYIQFTVDETSSGGTALEIRGEAVDNATTFSTTSFDISSRPQTIAAVSWLPAAWPTVGESGPDQRTVDISPVIQEIVNRPGWMSDSSLAIIITGTGTRIAEAYSGNGAGAAVLHIEYAYIPVPSDDVAVISVTAPSPVVVGQTQTVTVDVANQGTFTETFQVSLSDSLGATVGPPQIVTSLHSGGNSTLSFDWTPSVTGTHLLTATAETVTGETDTADNVETAVVEVFDGLMPVDVSIAARSDDAEEGANGAVDINSSDLELVEEDSIQTVGMRFNNITIPNSTTIAGAYIQFTVDETSSGTSALDIQGQAADNAATFSTASHDISSRPRTVAVVTWSPEAWDVVGEAGPAQRTVDISPVIQEIVNRPGWTSGSSLVIIITGTGTRIAEAYSGTGAEAAHLHAEYSFTPPPVHDVAVASVTAPTPVELGLAQTVTVDVSNEGTVGESFQVSLADSLGATVGPPQTVTDLQSGGNTTLSFDWTPSVTGTHILTATAETITGETDTADNVLTASAEVNPVPIHDVAVTGVIAPTPVEVGLTQTVTVDVSNEGTSQETFQVSLTDSLGATVGPPQTVTDLGAGGSSTLSFDWTPTITGTHLLTATAETVTGETDTADNVGTTTAEVTDVLVHDVAVTSVTAPTPVEAGQTQTVAVDVANEGTSQETFQVSLTDSLGATVGPPQTITDLGAGGSSTLSFDWTPTVTGTHILTATAATVAGESDTADNVGTTSAEVNPAAVHDVAVTSVAVPAPVEVGQAQIVTVDVANEGTVPEAFQVSLTDSLGATVGPPQTVTDLAAGGSSTLSFDWTPTVVGTHILTATAATVAGETDTADNVGTASAEVNPVPVHDVAVVSVTAPASVVVDQAQIVTVNVANQGTFAETFQVILADSLGATVGPPQTVTDLGAGGSSTLSFDWTPTVTGTHILTATAATVAGESDTADNVGTTSAEVNPAPVHDVAVTSVTAPTPAEAGQAQIVTVDISNEGTASETFQVSLTDSLGAAIGPPQTVTSLAAGGSSTLSFDWTPTVVGTHILTATAATVAGETDTADNVGTASAEVNPAPVHDVAVTSATAPTPVEAGQAQIVTVDVANQGTFVETFQVSLADSLGATVGPPQTVTDLAAGGSSTLSFDWTPTVVGTHILTATASVVIGESDTADNSGTATAVVNPVPVHDVAVTSVTAPTTAVVGQALIVTVNLTNEGTFVESFQVSLTDSLGATVGPPQTVVDLEVGGIRTLSFDWMPNVTGTHILTATAATVNGETDTVDNIKTATVETADNMTLLDISVAASRDDAEEGANGTVDFNSSDLELVEEDSIQKVGMRFNNVSIPRDAAVSSAYIQFTVDETSSGAAMLNIHGEAVDNAVTFSTASFDISSRPQTIAVVTWSPAAWATVGEAGPDQRTVDISPIIQEIVNRSGWASGASLAIIVTGTGTRIAESYNGSAASAPLLHVEYAYTPVPSNDVTVTSVTAPTPVVVGQTKTVTVDVANEGTFTETFQVSLTDSQDATIGQPQTVTNLQPGGNLTLSFDWTPNVTGTHILTATAETVSGETDTADNADTVTVEVFDGLIPVDISVAVSSDDAEEGANGAVDISSSDLELVEEDSIQTVGMRFNNVAIPQDATIAGAYIQFTVDETSSGAAALDIQGQAADNAATFSTASFDISSRPRTSAVVTWSPETWGTVGEAGPDQRTVDISPVVQEIVSRPGWASGSSLVIIITGTGTRIAESYNGSSVDAARLHIEYALANVSSEFGGDKAIGPEEIYVELNGGNNGRLH